MWKTIFFKGDVLSELSILSAFFQRRFIGQIDKFTWVIPKHIQWLNGLICFQEHTIQPRFVFGHITIFEGAKEGTKLQRKKIQSK